MTKNPYIRGLKKAMRVIDEKLGRILLTYGAGGIARDPQVKAACVRMLNEREALLIRLRKARAADRAVA